MTVWVTVTRKVEFKKSLTTTVKIVSNNKSYVADTQELLEVAYDKLNKAHPRSDYNE